MPYTGSSVLGRANRGGGGAAELGGGGGSVGERSNLVDSDGWLAFGGETLIDAEDGLLGTAPPPLNSEAVSLPRRNHHWTQRQLAFSSEALIGSEDGCPMQYSPTATQPPTAKPQFG